MEIIIRKPRLEPKVNGIPRDFADTMHYFNEALKSNSLSWIPRKTPITLREILDEWVPSINTNITLVAELEGKVVGQVTVFYDPKSTAYEHKEQRVSGNAGLTARPDIYLQAACALVPELIRELRKKDKTAVWTLAEESPANKVLADLGYKANILENQDRYKKIGLSGKVCEYELP